MNIVNELQSIGKFMFDTQLAWGNAGNISARLTQDTCLISASGTHLGELTEDDIIECSISNSVLTKPGKKPSKELPMHTAIYQERPEINAVLHASPLYSTLIACTYEEIPSNLFVESMYYLEKIERVPFENPGSMDLAERVREKAKLANILLLENHGILVYDTSIKEAKVAMQTLELACRMWIEAKQAGIELKGLSPETVHSFLNESGYKPRRRWGHL